jgi:predicted nucleic acid-binding protein
MLLDQIPAGSEVFLDANVLLFYFGSDPVYGPACKRLLERVEQQELTGVTSAHVLAEAMHRAMTIEAICQHGFPVKNIAQRLRRSPDVVQGLTQFRQLCTTVFQIGVRVVPMADALLDNAAEISQQYGLLTNDALLVATMGENGLTNLASQDADFDRVPGLVRYAPA